MEEFTKAEIERINTLYGTDFEGIQPADAMLIARFERNKALNEAEFITKCEAIQAESAAKIAQSEEQHKQAMSNLELLEKAALEKLKAVKNGK